MSFAEAKARSEGRASKSDKGTGSYDSLRDGYFEAKNKGGKALYDFVQQHKSQLEKLFADIPAEANLISLVPSIGKEASNSSDKEWVKAQNDALKSESSLRDAQIAAKEQSIKDARKRYRPDLAKLEADDATLTQRIKEELKHKGYNPTEEDVNKIKNELVREQERVRRANEYEQKPAWQRVAYSLLYPRSAESRAKGYSPSTKDEVLDAAEFVSNFLPYGAIASAPKAFQKIGRLTSKLDDLTKGVPGLQIAGDLAKGGGQLGLAEFVPSLGIRTADAIAYDDGRERGEQGALGVIGGAASDAVAAALLGHGAARLSPEKQKVLDAADEALKKQSKIAPREASQLREGFIDPRDERVADWRQYRTFKEAGDVKDFKPHDTMKNNAAWDELTGDVHFKQLAGLSGKTKQQVQDFMDATGLDYIDAFDAIADGKVKIGTPEEIAFMKQLKRERDKFYFENAQRALENAAIAGPAAAALLGRSKGAYKHMTEDRGYEE